MGPTISANINSEFLYVSDPFYSLLLISGSGSNHDLGMKFSPFTFLTNSGIFISTNNAWWINITVLNPFPYDLLPLIQFPNIFQLIRLIGFFAHPYYVQEHCIL